MMSRSKLETCLILFKSTLVISAFTFGGGFVILPLLERKFVKDLNWLTDEEVVDLLAIGQSAPGAIAVNVSIIIGYKAAGFLGGLFAVAGMVIPPFSIISVISIFYKYLIGNLFIDSALTGMQSGISAIIIFIAFQMARRFMNDKTGVVILVTAALGLFYFKIPAIYILIFAVLAGAVYPFIIGKRNNVS